MNTLRRYVIKLVALGLLSSFAHADQTLQPFTANSLAHIEAQYEGRAFVLILWSLHCAPCFAELEMLGKALERQPELPVVLVSTDELAHREHVLEQLINYGLAKVPTWQFADNIPEKLRFAIDQNWYGELPRSYYYDADHQRSSHSGALSQEQFAAWLGTED